MHVAALATELGTPLKKLKDKLDQRLANSTKLSFELSNWNEF